MRAALDPGLAAGEFLGAQVYASIAADVLVDLAVGEARVGMPMTTDTLVSWQCNTKPVTATAVALLWERGELDLDDLVVRYIPEFGTHGKDNVTLRHLLEHTAGFAQDPPLATLSVLSADEAAELVSGSRLVDGWRPGTSTLYSSWLGYATLGLVVARVSGQPFSAFVREEIFGPLDMDDCWIGVDAEREDDVAARMAFLYDTAGDHPEIPVLGPIAQAQGLGTFSPGSGGIGPMRQLARLYESHLGVGERPRLLRPETLAAMTLPLDGRSRRPYGLGFEVRPGAFGKSRPWAFGHFGLRTSLTCADRARRVVVSFMVNGFGTKPRDHMLGVVDAVYASLDELGLLQHPA